jgi:GPH family glycoside/pentoside/hexuronide:cation symporter
MAEPFAEEVEAEFRIVEKPPQERRERLSWGVLLAYGMPSFAGTAMVIPIAIHLPKFYSDVVLVPLGFLGLAIALSRSFDALTDPFFGWLSDRTHTRIGRRRPYFALAPLPCALAFYLLWSPPEVMAAETAALWFTTTFVLYFLFHTGYVIPHYALGPELTLDYHERSRLFAVREAFVALGTLAASLAPAFLEASLGPRRAFSLLAAVFAALLVALYGWLAFRVRERREFARRESNPFVPGVRRAMRNRPFRILLATYVIASVPGAIPGTLMPYYTAYVIRPENVPLTLGLLIGVYFLSGFLFIPVWLRAARRFGKRAAWLASFVAGTTGGPLLFLLGEGDVAPLVAILAWTGSAFGAGLFLGPAIQADVIDYDELHTGKRREAQYGAFWSILPKFIVIPSAAVPITIIGALGYVPNQPVQNEEVTLAIRALFALTPAFFSLLAFPIAWRLPITERVHRRILEGIDAHARGESAEDPLTGRLVAPPRSREVDEEASWFLDHFSARELRRALERGPRAVRASAARWALLAAALCAAAAASAWAGAGDFGREPGVAAVAAVVLVGVFLSMFVFHALRLAAARRLLSSPMPAATIRAHLDGG